MLVKRPDIILRTIHGSIFLIDISDNYSGDKCAIYEINETGKFLWNNIDRKGTVENLVKALQEVILDDVPYSELYNDVLEYIKSLKNKQFILEVDVNG